MAKLVKRHPKAVTSPPITAVTLVDLVLQNAITIGDTSNDVPIAKAPNHSENNSFVCIKNYRNLIKVLKASEEISSPIKLSYLCCLAPESKTVCWSVHVEELTSGFGVANRINNFDNKPGEKNFYRALVYFG